MALDNNYLEYPQRNYGMDHNNYTWSMLANRPKVTFKNGKKIALWVNVCLQHFPLNSVGKPFKAPGSLTMPYPDLRHYTIRDYGNRVGIFRLLKAFEKHNINPSFAINANLALQYPALMQIIENNNTEIIAHGWDMDTLHYGGLPLKEEEAIIQKTLKTLQQYFTKPITGWLSPARSQSNNTPHLLAAEGIKYFADWVNDDMPYTFNTQSGNLVAMPLSYELEDQFIILNNQHSEASYAQQIIDAFEFLLAESDTQGGRILSLNIHPWMLGQPHRIKYLEQALAHIMANSNVFNATANELINL